MLIFNDDNERWARLKRALEHPAQDAAEQMHEAHVDRIVERLNEWLALQFAEDERDDNRKDN